MEYTNKAEPFEIALQFSSPKVVEVEVLIAGFFRYEVNGPALEGGAKELDDALGGLISAYRRDGLFGGKLGKVVWFLTPEKTIAAKSIMLIGLGNRRSFSLAKAETVGCLALRNAVARSFQHIAFAPQVWEGGLSKFSVTELFQAFTRGAWNEHAAISLAKGTELSIHSFQLLAGEAEVVDALYDHGQS
jgi:hypothetical protein